MNQDLTRPSRDQPDCPIQSKRRLAGTVTFPPIYPEVGKLSVDQDCDEQYIVVEQRISSTQCIRAFILESDVRAIAVEAEQNDHNDSDDCPPKSPAFEFFFNDFSDRINQGQIDCGIVHIDRHAQVVAQVECGLIATDLQFVGPQQARQRSSDCCGSGSRGCDPGANDSHG